MPSGVLPKILKRVQSCQLVIYCHPVFFLFVLLLTDFPTLDHLATSTPANVQAQTVEDLIRRLVGVRASEFTVVINSTIGPPHRDTFKVYHTSTTFYEISICYCCVTTLSCSSSSAHSLLEKNCSLCNKIIIFWGHSERPMSNIATICHTSKSMKKCVFILIFILDMLLDTVFF